jgi:octaprenyl-diphosphate synthase
MARAERDEALSLLQTLPASIYRDSLEQLARFAVDRCF